MINFNFINQNNEVLSVSAKGRYVLEVCNKDQTGNRLALFLLQQGSGYFEELGAELFITPYVMIQNAVWESEDFYFPALSYENGGKFRVDLYKYASRSRTCDILYSFTGSGTLSENELRYKVFILSESTLLIQKETLDDTHQEKRMGHICFSQIIVDLESKEETEIKEENLNNNGLNSIIAISPVQTMTKTGYSYIEDTRFSSRTEKDALIESVSIHTTSRLIADLSLGATTIDAYLLSSAYYSQYILTPQFIDDYVYYLIVNPDEGSSVSVFYNVITTEQMTCKNEMLDMDDLRLNYVIRNNPYVKNSAMPETKFLNLKTMDFDLSAMNEEFVDVIGELIVLRTTNRKKEPVLEFYHYPEMTLLYREKGRHIKGCKSNKNDDYYIYVYE